jgi:glyoxylase-like metal-dependent hydrolase (beta-lactamase superfamily II)
MSVEIQSKTLGMVSTNAYLVADTDTNEAILIDPVDEARTLVEWAEQLGWTIKLILATHAHFDHVPASQELVELTGAPFYIHEEAAPYLESLPLTGVRFTGQRFPEAAQPDRLLKDNEEITRGAVTLKALYTPGHAPGHLSFYLERERVVFAGDALFAGSIGRTDLEGGDFDVLMHSIQTRLLPLGDETRVLPGHMGQTTIGKERETNPYLLRHL